MSTDSVLQLVDPNEFARCLFEESNDALILFDPESLRLIDANPSAQRLTEIPRRQLLKRKIPELFDADDPELLAEFIESCHLTRGFHSRESYQIVRDNGEAIDVNVTISRLHLTPSPVGVVAIRDVSERRQLESNLRETQSLLRATIDNQADNLEAATAELRSSQQRMHELLNDVGAIVWEAELPSRQYTYVSNHAEAILGYPIEQWLEEPSFWVNHLHPDDVDAAMSAYQQSAGGKENNEFDYRSIAANGTVVWLHDTIRVVKNERGEPVKLRGIMTDISVKVQAEQQLESLERELAHVSRLSTLGAMVAGIAHEVNQPLSAISNFASAAQNQLKASSLSSESPLHEWMCQIREQAVRCGDIIRGLRRFTRKSDIRQEPFVMRDVVYDSMALLRAMLREQSVNVEVEWPAGDVQILGDATELQQVMVNLISNACESVVEASTSHPLIRIRGEVCGDRLRVSVIDNGPGVNPCDAAKIFDPFFTTRREGLGMGLAISRSIIENHQGELDVDTNTVDGACFSFELPIEA